MMSGLEQSRQNWYCIKFDVPKNIEITALEFSKKMNDFLEQINEFNHSIVDGIDDTYTVASYIEDFESGSIKWWLVDKLNKISDKAIDKFVESPIKTTIAGILKSSKNKTIKYLNSEQFKDDTPEKRKNNIISPILEDIRKENANLNQDFLFPKSISVDEHRLLKSLSKMSEISKDLEGNIFFINDYNNQNNHFVISQNINPEAFINIDEPRRNEASISEYEQIFSIVSIIFKKDNKWRLFNGDYEISATIKDANFLENIENGKINFSKGDQLKCIVRLTQFETANGLKNEYEILKVKKHVKRPEQMDLLKKTNR